MRFHCRSAIVAVVALAISSYVLSYSEAMAAATISANPASTSITVGHATDVTISLDLGTDVASIFEGNFDLVGLGTVGGALLTPGGPTWDSSFGNIVANQAQVSLTSSNTGGNRLVGTIQVTGLAPGTFYIVLADGTILQQDTDTPPFVADVPFATSPGTTLASIEVGAAAVPEPGSLALLGAGVVLLSRRRRRASGV